MRIVKNLFLLVLLPLTNVTTGFQFLLPDFVPHDLSVKITELISNIKPEHEKIVKEHIKAVDTLHKDSGYFIIKSISSVLPHFDLVAHDILHANDELIGKILVANNIPHELKANLILMIIKISQRGDDFGSHVLQIYYDIVERCFH